jgi:hypothetical protein
LFHKLILDWMKSEGPHRKAEKEKEEEEEEEEV